MSNLSDQSIAELRETIVAFFEADGEPDADQIADDTISQCLEGTYTFELWDALGSDDLGLVANNKQLTNLYKSVSTMWEQSRKAGRQ